MAESGAMGFLSKETAGLPNWAWVAVVGVGAVAAFVLPKFFGGGNKTAPTPDVPGTTGATPTTGGTNIGLAIDPTTGLPYAVEGLVPSGNAGPVQGGIGPAGPAGAAGAIGAAGPAGPAGAPGAAGAAGGIGPAGPGGAPGAAGAPGNPAPTPAPPGNNTPGSSFLGPTGVHHYIATGNETLSDIARKFGFSSWNDVYAIPANQALFGAMNASQAAGYRPPMGMVITIPTTPAPPPVHTPGPAPAPVGTPQPPAQYVTVQAWPNALSTLSGIASSRGITVQRLQSLNPNITNPTTIQPGQKVRVS